MVSFYTERNREYIRNAILISLALSVTLPSIDLSASSHADTKSSVGLVFAPSSGPTYGYSRQWGSFGGPSGPNGVALDSLGNVYIADSQNYAVGKMAKNGTLLGMWGSQGSGQSQFNNPFGIAVDSGANVFVTDSVNNNVQKFSSTGNLLVTWNSNGNGTLNGMLLHPQGIAVNSSGYVYVVDQGHEQVGIFRNDGTFAEYFRLGPPGNFTMALGIAIDSMGFVYVDDDNTSFNDGFSGNVTKFTRNGAFVSSWGGANTGGTLFWPQGMAVDSSFNIYVADNGANRIEKFDSNHRLQLSFGSTGTLPGQFSYPIGVAVDSQGNVFVGDPINFNVQLFSSTTGSYITSVSYQRTGRLSDPYGCAVDRSGYIYIADRDNNRVQKFNSLTGSFLAAWGVPGNRTGQFNTPSGVAVDRNGNIYVTDSNNNRIQKFLSDGTFIKAWGSFGTDNGQFYSPSGIAVDNSNNVYVTDSNNDRVEKFDSSGSFISVWGSTGSNNGQFNGPQGIAVDSAGTVYVSDSGNNRIEKFTGSGVFLATWGTPGSLNGQFSSPEGIGLDSAGNLFVADTFNSRIQEFLQNGTFLTTFGTSGAGNGQLANPLGVAVDNSDNVYVTDSNLLIPGTASNRVEVFAPFHDTSVTSLTLSRNTAYSGITMSQPVKLTVIVSNLGLANETVWVKTFANATIIDQQNVTLFSGSFHQVIFSWFPSTWARGKYNITAQVQVVSGDPNPVNNSIQGGLFYVRMRGDVIGDCKVNILDLIQIANTFGSSLGQTSYNSNADLNNDGKTNILDLVIVAQSFGLSC